MDIRRDWPPAMNRYATLFVYCAPILAGTLTALQQLTDIGMQHVEDRVGFLSNRLRQGLAGIPTVAVHTKDGLGAGITAFSLANLPPAEVIGRLKSKHGIIGRIVDHGVVSFSAARLCTHVFNTAADVDCAVAAIRKLAQET